ncbi:cadherin-related family member 2 [Mustelus asterias]
MSALKIFCSLLLVFSLFLEASAQHPPEFAKNMTVVYVAEDTMKGAEAYKIIAFDKDNDKLTYSMTGVDSTFFNLNENIVIVARKLDREIKPMLRVTLGVSDGSNDATLHQTIILEDANDNAPVFLNGRYTVSVYENETEGATLFTVEAVDNDQGPAGRVQYKILDVLPDAPYLFGIQMNGSVTLNGTLSYAERSTFYQLQIEASDHGGMYNGTFIIQKTIAFAFIKVKDVPDMNPIFLNIPYQATVPENSSVGTTVFQVLAIDGDRGIEDEIIYAIQSSKAPNLFQIDARSGNIFVSGFLDREELDFNAIVELQVTATERHLDVNGAIASSNTSVSITVTDINDNTPAFYNCNLDPCNFTESAKVNSFNTSIPEHFSTGVPIEHLTIVARDPDQGMNGTFVLSLRGKDASVFEVNPKVIINVGMVQITVRNSSAVDYEQRNVIHIEIVANDTTNPTKCCATANLTINIEDINDHSPEFPSQTYILSVKEHAAIGTEVGIVNATDLDSGIFGQITYSLLPMSIRNEFNVNSTTGIITVQNSTTLDREKRPVYYATLQATDGGNRIGTTALEIILEDINDFPPVLTRDSYTAFIMENNGNELNIRIEAFDNDQEGTNNSEIRYTIVAGDYQHNFTIDPNKGILRSVGPVDREEMKPSLGGKIILIVEAYDLGVPSLSSTVNVTINVEDENDNSPIFTESVYNASVMEDTLGAFVTLVQATDNDATEVNNRVIYRIETGSTGTFLIRTMLIKKADPKQYQGNITVDPTIALDYDRGPKSYTLGVSASDSGFPSKSASATVYVTVLDMNDETPVLDTGSMKNLNVMENTTQLGIVRNITASDIDTNHSLIYQLISVVCLKSEIIDVQPDAPCRYWFGLYDNGSLYVNESLVIDYEEYNQVDITIRVTDLYTQKNKPSSTGKLTINIVDANDNAPVFLAFERVSVIVPELAPISAEIATVKASDNDTGKNAEINFVVTKVLFIFSDDQPHETLPDVFEASRATFVGGEYTATIKIKSSLDKTLRGQYKVTIEASDGGNPTLSATSYLDLITVDESYKTRLEFSLTPAGVQENMDDIIKKLQEATNSKPLVAGVHVVSNTKVQTSSRKVAKSIMEVYFIYNNGTAIPPENIVSILEFNPEAVTELIDLGLLNIKQPTEPIDTARPLLATIGGLIAAFIILLAIMITALVCSRQSYKRKIKSITAMNTAKEVTVNALQSGPVVPGTNKYTSEGANPVWNTAIDFAADLGFEEPNSDRASINSLDENVIDTMPETPTKKFNTEMTEKTINSHPIDEKTKPLSAALDDHDNNKEKTPGELRHEIYIKSTPDSIDI